MQKSWLLRYPLLILLANSEALAYGLEAKVAAGGAFSVAIENPTLRKPSLDEAVISETIKVRTGPNGLPGRVTDATGMLSEREAPVLPTPRPTITPLQGRQDDGQIQALSAELQSLSQSATQAISSVSSSALSVISQISQSAQSVRQSADQAVQSANQAADQANRQLTQTQSSASSAVSAANARASEQLSQSLSSMSSRISSNLASAQSSASSAISSAQVVASQFAASQIQAAKAEASGVTGDANPFMDQARSNSISTSTVAIIATASIVGTAILTALSTCFLLRYRRKRKASRQEEALLNNEKGYNMPVAVRGSTSPRFPRFGRDSGSPMDNFKLPSLSPLIKAKKARREQKKIGLAASDYGDQSEGSSRSPSSEIDKKPTNADGTQSSTTFRLQKDNGVSNATTVRLIRVGSEKGKGNAFTANQKTGIEPMPPPTTRSASDGPPKQASLSVPGPAPTRPAIQSSSRANPIILSQPPKVKETSSEQQRQSARGPEVESPGWRPSVRSTIASRNRFRFRDSSDIESEEPTPTSLDPDANTANPRVPRASNLFPRVNEGDGSSTFPRRPKNAGATFATFPRLREGSRRESMINRGRPMLRPRIRGNEATTMQGRQETVATTSRPENSTQEQRAVERDSRDLF